MSRSAEFTMYNDAAIFWAAMFVAMLYIILPTLFAWIRFCMTNSNGLECGGDPSGMKTIETTTGDYDAVWLSVGLNQYD